MAGKIMDAAGLMKFIKSSKGFDIALKNLNIVTIKDGNCVAELKVGQEHLNPIGGLHGGFSATLVDCVTTYALMSKVEVPNVSVDMHMTYLKGAKENDEIVIDAKVIRSGKSVAFLEADIKNKLTGDILVKGSHTKYLLQQK